MADQQHRGPAAPSGNGGSPSSGRGWKPPRGRRPCAASAASIAGKMVRASAFRGMVRAF